MFCTSPSAVNCLVFHSAPFCCLPFCSTQFLTFSTHPNIKPDKLPYSALLSTKWRAIFVRWVIQRLLLCEKDYDIYCYTGRNMGIAGYNKWLHKAAATLEPEPTKHNSLDRLQTRKWLSHYRICQRLQWNRSDCLTPIKWVCLEPTVWPDTCCSAHWIRVLLQWTKRIY
jgi:hypothetical protein